MLFSNIYCQNMGANNFWSDWDGFNAPDGWLCTSTIPVLAGLSDADRINRGSATDCRILKYCKRFIFCLWNQDQYQAIDELAVSRLYNRLVNELLIPRILLFDFYLVAMREKKTQPHKKVPFVYHLPVAHRCKNLLHLPCMALFEFPICCLRTMHFFQHMEVSMSTHYFENQSLQQLALQ